MQYPLPESIGNPDLLVGREKEFALLDKWMGRIPKRLSKSRAILARRKSGKTAMHYQLPDNKNRSVVFDPKTGYPQDLTYQDIGSRIPPQDHY